MRTNNTVADLALAGLEEGADCHAMAREWEALGNTAMAAVCLTLFAGAVERHRGNSRAALWVREEGSEPEIKPLAEPLSNPAEEAWAPGTLLPRTEATLGLCASATGTAEVDLCWDGEDRIVARRRRLSGRLKPGDVIIPGVGE